MYFYVSLPAAWVTSSHVTYLFQHLDQFKYLVTLEISSILKKKFCIRQKFFQLFFGNEGSYYCKTMVI